MSVRRQAERVAKPADIFIYPRKHENPTHGILQDISRSGVKFSSKSLFTPKTAYPAKMIFPHSHLTIMTDIMIMWARTDDIFGVTAYGARFTDLSFHDKNALYAQLDDTDA